MKVVRSKLVKSGDPILSEGFAFADHSFESATAGRLDATMFFGFNKPPAGFWYQVGDGWEEWCRYSQDSWLHDHRVVLSVDLSRFAVLSGEVALGDFISEYGVGSRIRNLCAVDWRRVMEEFDGVEMPDYNHAWSFGDSAGWTYGWDCASGVCWRPSKAVEILRIEDRKETQPPKP